MLRPVLNSKIFLIMSFLIACSTTPKIATPESVDAKWGRVTSSCVAPKTAKKVYVFKQWHLSPTIDTSSLTPQSLPQERNQTAIYSQISFWIEKGILNTVFSEGCEGEINEKFQTKFNGWDYNMLKPNAEIEGYRHILTLIPLKLEAKYGDKLLTLCADSNDLIRKSELEFSNIRGLQGFSTRLKEYASDPDKLQSYLDEVNKLLKLPDDTSSEIAQNAIRDEIRSSIGKIKELISSRDDVILKNILKTPSQNSVLVIGGAHAEDLKYKLEKNNIGCDIIEPVGYEYDPDAMFKALEN